MKKAQAIKRELERIAKASGGVLHPVDVVESARPKTSPLHSRFEWDDGEAADKYRLWQARMLIAITVTVSEHTQEDEQVWVSLKTDRAEDGGYRPLIAVLGSREMREALLKDAFEDMEIFKRKYRHLKELAAVFAAFDGLKKKERGA